jgi:hypothetical protein
MFSLLTGESLIPKLALTVIVVLFMLFGILPDIFCVKPIFVSSIQGGRSIYRSKCSKSLMSQLDNSNTCRCC